jgi:predicted metal-dependent peptidase
MTADKQARDKVAAARVWLMKHKPFFGVLARALRIEASTQVSALRLHADDRLQIHPDVVMEMRFSPLCARMAHVSLHAALNAFSRRRGRETRRWNVAHDLAIAPLLDAAGLSVGAPLALHGQASLAHGTHLSAEAHFDALPEGVAPDPLWCDMCDLERDEDGASAPDGGVPLPSAEERGLELQWKIRLGAALEEELASGGKTFGDMPDWIDELVRATIEPPADWSAALQHAVSNLQRTTRSYLRPSRRMSALMDEQGRWPDTVTMPGRRIEQAGRLVAIVDTSASVTPATLSRFLGAIASAATAEGIDQVRLMQADAAITRDDDLYAAELLFHEVQMSGRGGTDFGPAIRQLATESRKQVQRFTVVYLTDLDGRFPSADESEPLDVLWVTPHAVQKAPPFGRHLVMHSAARS